MKAAKKLNQKKARRAARVRATIIGTAERPRLSVRRSNKYFYAQLIDDTKGHTILSASSAPSKKKKTAVKEKAVTAKKTTTKTADSFAVGEIIGKKATEKGIAVAVFDRRSYKFHGRVKSFVDGAKKAGLKI
jgi:large subunit ribosomal protein L18